MLRKLFNVFHELGVTGGLVYLADRLLSLLSRSLRVHLYDFVVQPVPVRPPSPPGLRSAVTVKALKAGDPEIGMMTARPEVKAARFERGAACLGAFRGERFIGHVWFSFGPYAEDEVRCTYRYEPRDEAVFDFDLYVFPEYRMSRAFLQLWSEAGAYLRSRGIRYTYSRIARANIASGRAHRQLRAARVGSALFITAGPAQLMIGTVYPYVHLGLGRRSRVELRLRPAVLPRTKSRKAHAMIAGEAPAGVGNDRLGIHRN